jgi:hypothetical protein
MQLEDFSQTEINESFSISKKKKKQKKKLKIIKKKLVK